MPMPKNLLHVFFFFFSIFFSFRCLLRRRTFSFNWKKNNERIRILIINMHAFVDRSHVTTLTQRWNADDDDDDDVMLFFCEKKRKRHGNLSFAENWQVKIKTRISVGSMAMFVFCAPSRYRCQLSQFYYYYYLSHKCIDWGTEYGRNGRRTKQRWINTCNWAWSRRRGG